jgi:DNA-directed RNA polymerase specialized sigma24 family protein
VPASGDAKLRAVAAKASRGDREALESALVCLRDDVYRLALRMLWLPQDAEDATQEAPIEL